MSEQGRNQIRFYEVPDPVQKHFTPDSNRRHLAKLWIADAAEPIRGGMSGSPILATDGAAIDIVCVSGGEAPETHTQMSPISGYLISPAGSWTNSPTSES